MTEKPTERTDYRKMVDRDFMGQWDLTRDDGSYIKAVVQIANVARYVPRERKRVKLPGQVDAAGKQLYEPERLKRLKITFVGKRKGWLAGPVSQTVLASLFGPIVQDWIGKRIELYVDPKVKFGRNVTGGLRVSPKSPDMRQPLTEDPLDNEVDLEKAAELDAAASEFEESEEDASP